MSYHFLLREANAGGRNEPFWLKCQNAEFFHMKIRVMVYEAWFEVLFFRNVQQKSWRNLQRKFVNNPDDAINVIVFFFTVFLSAYGFLMSVDGHPTKRFHCFKTQKLAKTQTDWDNKDTVLGTNLVL